MTDPTTAVADPQARKRTRLRDERLFFLLLGAVTVSVTVSAATFVGAGAAIAATVGMLVALGVLGWALWRSGADHHDGYQNLGTGLLVSVVVAGAVGGAQLAIEHRQAELEDRRETKARLISERETLRVTLGGPGEPRPHRPHQAQSRRLLPGRQEPRTSAARERHPP